MPDAPPAKVVSLAFGADVAAFGADAVAFGADEAALGADGASFGAELPALGADGAGFGAELPALGANDVAFGADGVAIERPEVAGAGAEGPADELGACVEVAVGAAMLPDVAGVMGGRGDGAGPVVEPVLDGLCTGTIELLAFR